MKISGHKTRSVFDRYNITSEEDLRQAAIKMGQYFEAGKGTLTGTPQRVPIPNMSANSYASH